MAIRTKLLSGRNINTDSDFSKYIETVSEPGVIEGMVVSSGKVGVGKCRVPCERTNGETIYSLVENFTEITIDTSGTGFVIVSIPQNMIDDGSIINEDGTNVASIEVVTELPTKNYLKLASINEGVITDERNMIKKVGELNTAIENLFSRIENIDERVENLEEAAAIDHLEIRDIIGEKYTSSNYLFKQITPKLSNCNIDCNVGDVNSNKEIHIQRISNGVEFDLLKLKIRKNGAPTTSLKVEVRKGVQVNVSSTEAYWYGDSSQILASGSVAYSDIGSSFSEITVDLSNNVQIDEGGLLDIVVYQESSGSIVINASNYYILACDKTQYSEAFSYVSVNGTTRTRSKLMPYCISEGFKESLLCKINATSRETSGTVTITGQTKESPTTVVNLKNLAYVKGFPGTKYYYMKYVSGNPYSGYFAALYSRTAYESSGYYTPRPLYESGGGNYTYVFKDLEAKFFPNKDFISGDNRIAWTSGNTRSTTAQWKFLIEYDIDLTKITKILMDGVYDIGEYGSGNIFGMSDDGSFYDSQREAEDEIVLADENNTASTSDYNKTRLYMPTVSYGTPSNTGTTERHLTGFTIEKSGLYKIYVSPNGTGTFKLYKDYIGSSRVSTLIANSSTEKTMIYNLPKGKYFITCAASSESSSISASINITNNGKKISSKYEDLLPILSSSTIYTI